VIVTVAIFHSILGNAPRGKPGRFGDTTDTLHVSRLGREAQLSAILGQGPAHWPRQSIASGPRRHRTCPARFKLTSSQEFKFNIPGRVTESLSAAGPRAALNS
jgi:hypothetical protein